MQQRPLLTGSQRILVHLSRFADHERGIVVPWAITQEGIAICIEAERKSIVMALKRLENSGHIIVQKRHVDSAKTVRKAYFLTEMGRDTVRKMIESAKGIQINLIDMEGAKRKLSLEEVVSSYSPELKYADVLLAIHNDELDLRRMHGIDRTSRKALIKICDSMPIMSLFFGRQQEIAKLEEFIHRREIKSIVVTGIPGIGKTTLITELVKRLNDQYDIAWFNLTDWTGLKGVLRFLGEFLSVQNKPNLLKSISVEEAPELAQVEMILRTDLGEATGILVLDDIHKMDDETMTAFSVILRLLRDTDSKLKLILIGRYVPRFYDVRETKIGERIAILELKELDEESCRSILKAREVPEQYWEYAINQSRGHPLCLELFEASSSTAQPLGFIDFVRKEMLSSLSPMETDVLRVISLSRGAVGSASIIKALSEIHSDPHISPVETERNAQTSIQSLAKRNLLHEVSHGVFDTHELLRDLFMSDTTAQISTKIHDVLAESYVRGSDPESINEAIHHLSTAGKYEKAIEIALANYSRILPNVGCQTIKNLIETASAKGIGVADQGRFLLMKVEVEELSGDWKGALTTIAKVWEWKECDDPKTLALLIRLKGIIKMKRGEMSEAMSLLKKAKEMATDQELIEQVAMNSFDLGNLYHREGLLGEAKKEYEEAYEASRKVSNELLAGRALYGLSKLYSAEEKIDKAIETGLKAAAVFKRTGAMADYAKTLSGIGVDFDSTGEYDKAIAYHEKAVETAEKAGDVVTKAYSLSNCASSLIMLHRIDDAKRKIVIAEEIADRMGDKLLLSLIDMVKGSIDLNEGRNEEAEGKFRACLDLASESSNFFYYPNWCIRISDLYQMNGMETRSKEYIEKALNSCRNSGLKDLESYIEKRMLSPNAT
jgi:tetratricopeptide (TPR) repeat protein/DNA-binding PadR family transcriptional regulator/GTPase SAR1 family protein